MYEHFKLCPDLKPRELCLVVEQYFEGKMLRKFHEHVPRHRLSTDQRRSLLRSLVIKFGDFAPETVVRMYVNKRGKKPEADPRLRMVVAYAEPGVHRLYCGTDTVAWVDDVVNPSDFRRDLA